MFDKYLIDKLCQTCIELHKKRHITLLYPITKFKEVYVEKSIELDIENLQNFDVLKFYDEMLTKGEALRLIEAMDQGLINDTFGYIQRNVIEQSNPEGVKRRKLLGSMVFFKNLEKISDNKYKVNILM